MKQIIIIPAFFLLYSAMAFSQSPALKVNTWENVSIGPSSPTAEYSYKLSIFNSTGGALYIHDNATSSMSGVNVVLPNLGTGSGLAMYRSAVSSTVLSGGSGYDFALKGSSFNLSPQASGRAYGVYGEAGNATNGCNYGVFGLLRGSNNGAAICGRIPSDYVLIPGKYAGYFDGRIYMSERLGIGITAPTEALDVVGSIRYSVNCYKASDSRLKTNVTDFGSTLEQIGKLRPVKYNLKPNDYSEYYDRLKEPSISDTSKTIINNDDDLRQYFALDKEYNVNQKHFGFIAQELREVFPELVNEDDKGMLSIDYVSLIPVLVGAIQEQSETIQTLNGAIQELNSRLKTLENKNNTRIDFQGEGTKNFSFSIFPNPTNGFVMIDYTLFSNTSISIELYNMFGQRVKLIAPQQNQKAGTYSVQTSVSNLVVGTYLVKATSGSQVESKQLVIE